MRSHKRTFGRSRTIAIATAATFVVCLSGAVTGSMIGDTAMVSRSDHAYEMPTTTIDAAGDSKVSYVAKKRVIDGEEVQRGALRFSGRDQPAFFAEYTDSSQAYLPVDGTTSAPEYRAARVHVVAATQVDPLAAAHTNAMDTPAQVSISRGTERTVATIEPANVVSDTGTPRAPLFSEEPEQRTDLGEQPSAHIIP